MTAMEKKLNEAKNTCTGLDIARQLDKLKSQEGAVDHVKVEKLINQLNQFGPFYRDLLKTIAANLK